MRRTIAFPLVLGGTLGPAFAAEGADGSMLVQPHFGLAFWTLVTFLLLMFILRKVAWKPLLGAVEARERGIRESIEQAGKDRDEAQSMLEQTRAELKQARRERAEAVAAGQADAERLKAEILDAARQEREKLMAQADERIRSEMQQARGELRRLAADYAVLAAEKLIAKNLDEPTQRKLIEDYLDDLERSGGDTPRAN